MRLAVGRHKPPNVRFYAACRVADILATNEEFMVRQILKQVDDAPIIETQFIGGNKLNATFYVPGRAQPHLSVRSVIEQRLLELRTPGDNQ